MRGLRLYGVPLASALLGVLASFVLWFDIAKWEDRLAQSEFDLLAQDRVTVVQDQLLADVDAVRMVAGFMDASSDATRAEFQQFSLPVLRRQSAVHAIEWVEAIPGSLRKQYERRIAAEGFPEGIRRRVSTRGLLERAPTLKVHYPVTFTVPTDRSATPIGVDYSFDQTVAAAFDRAAATDQVQVTLVESGHQAIPGRALLVTAPVRWHRTNVIRGYVLLWLGLEAEVSEALTGLTPDTVSISIFDVFANGGGLLLLHHRAASHRDSDLPAEAPTVDQVRRYIMRGTKGVMSSDLYYLDTVMVGGRRLLFVATPSSEFFAVRIPWQSTAALIGGFIFTGVVSLAFYLVGDRSMQMEELSRSRERELHAMQRLASLYNSSPDIMATVRDGVITECNDTMVRVLGVARNELIGAPIESLHHEADRDTLLDAITTAGDASHSVEVRLTRRNAEEIETLLGVRSIVSSAGDLEVLCVWRDNTELREAQAELFHVNLRQQSEARFRLTIDACPNAILVVDDTGHIVMANDTAEKLFGYTLAELVDKNVEMLMPEPVRTRHPAYVASYFESPTRRTLGIGRDLHAIRKDGTDIPVEIGLAPYTTEDGVYAIVSVTDVSRRAAALKQLREEKDRFQELIVNSRGVLWLYDLNTRRSIYVSPTYEEIYGRSSDAVLNGSNPDDWLVNVHPEDRQRTREAVETALTNLTDLDVEYRLVRQGGVIRYIWVRGRAVPNEAGEPERYAGIAEDVTEMARVRVELERSNDDLERFAYIASHDLQEPLRMISSYVALLAERYVGRLDQDADEFIGFAVNGAKRMQALVNDLLAYSRSGRQLESPPIIVDASEIVQQALDNLRTRIEETGAVVAVQPSLPTIKCHPTQMIQVFQNLVANALKFRRKDVAPEVSITAEQCGHGQERCFAVADNGIGIEKSQAERIFQPFTRVHSYDQYEGSGIGLAVCKRVVERLGGRIWVTSTPGSGAVFRFTVPTV